MNAPFLNVGSQSYYANYFNTRTHADRARARERELMLFLLHFINFHTNLLYSDWSRAYMYTLSMRFWCMYLSYTLARNEASGETTQARILTRTIAVRIYIYIYMDAEEDADII